MKFFTLGSTRTSSNNTCYSGAVPNPTVLKTRYRFKIGSLLVLMIFGLAMFMPSRINAQSIIVDANPDDWAVLQALSPQPATYAHIGDNFGNGVIDDQFTEGAKDFFEATDLAWADGQTKAKNDIANAAAFLEDGNLYFAGDKTSNNGDAQIGFWFYLGDTGPYVESTKNGIRKGNFRPPHTYGDLLILVDFTGGGRNGTVKAYKWVGVGFGKYGTNKSLDDADAGSAVAAHNALLTRDVPAGWLFTSRTYDLNEFFEGKIDLTKTGLSNFCFSHFMLEGRSSQEITASLDDFASGAFSIQPNPTARNLTACEVGTTGSATFNLADGLVSADGGTVTYYGSLADANAATNPLTAAGFAVSIAQSGKTIWIRSDFVIGTGSSCSGLTTFTITVNDNPDVITAPLSSCETGSTSQATFTLNAGVTDADGGTLSFYTDAALLNMISDADGVLAGVQYTTGTRTIYVKSVSGICVGTAQFAITVNDNPDVTTAPLSSCETGSTGQATFTLNAGVTDADSGTLSFYTDAALLNMISDADGVLAGVQYTTGTATIYVKSVSGTCVGTGQFAITVNDNPDVTTAPLSSCETGSTGMATFTLNAGVTDADGGTLSFYTDAALLNMISDENED